MYLRLLNPAEDACLFRTVWNWQFDKPRSWQQMFAVWRESEAEFYDRAKTDEQLDFGVFDDEDNFIAIITLIEAKPGCFEASFDCRRGTSPQTLVDAIFSVKQEVFSFGRVKEVYCYVANRNRGLKRILMSCGFHQTHIAIIKGEMRGRIVEWEQFKIINQTNKKRVYILTFCRKPELLYGTLLVFETLRVGFPTAAVTVFDNNSLPEVRGEIEAKAGATGCDYYQLDDQTALHHHDFIARILAAAAEDDSVIFVDPDIIFWENCEDWQFSQLLAGRLIPKFTDEYSGCVTRERLHTSFLWIPHVGRLRQRIEEITKSYFEFQPIAPVMFPTDAGWQRLDTGASLYAAIKSDVYSFTMRELNSYDHLFCGSHIDWLLGAMNEADALEIGRVHNLAKTDFSQLKGIWEAQEDYFTNRRVE